MTLSVQTIVWRCSLIPQLVGKACQLGCPKIVLDHVRVYSVPTLANVGALGSSSSLHSMIN